MFRFLLFVACSILFVSAAKRNRMSQAGKIFELWESMDPGFLWWQYCLEVNACIEKTNDLNTACEFVKCFHDRYRCNEESVTAWALELCHSFPKEVVFQFTPQVSPDMHTDRNESQSFRSHREETWWSIFRNVRKTFFFKHFVKENRSIAILSKRNTSIIWPTVIVLNNRSAKFSKKIVRFSWNMQRRWCWKSLGRNLESNW